MKITVFLVIIEITLVLTNSYDDINSTALPSNIEFTTQAISSNNQTNSQDGIIESTVSSKNIEITSTLQPLTTVTSSVKTNNNDKTIRKSTSTSSPSSLSSVSSLSSNPTTSLFSSFSTDEWLHTKILTKKGLDLRNHADKSIQIACPIDGDFQTLIRDSSFWVDKSLLIRKIWQGLWKCNVVVTAPPKWGKTINLSMIKFHCDLSLDSNGFETPRNQSASYLYFNEGKILFEDGSIVELDEKPLLSGYLEHLANHPVIYISGVNLSIDNSLESFRTMIHETYRRHESLLKRLNKAYSKASSRQRPDISRNITEFRQFYEPENARQLNETYLTRGIQILSKLLFYAYKRKVIVLFDDYDQYAHKAYFEGTLSNQTDHIDNGSHFGSLWEIFLRNTFKQNRHLEKAILSGVLKAQDPGSLPSYPNYYNAYVFDDEDLFPYYGFFDKEVDQLAAKRGIDPNLVDNATRWYGGYRTLSNLGNQMYSPYSVTRFLNTLQIHNYWPTSSLSKFINRLIGKPEFRERIRCLSDSFAEGKNIVTPLFYRTFKGLDLQDYAEVQMIDLDQVKYYGLHEDVVFSILASCGYLAVFEYNRSQAHILIRIPNREIYNRISSVIN